MKVESAVIMELAGFAIIIGSIAYLNLMAGIIAAGILLIIWANVRRGRKP